MGLFLKFTLQCKSLLDCRRGMVTSNQFPSFPGLSGGQTRASTPPPSPLAAHTRMQPNLVQTRKSSSGALSVGPQTSCTRIAWKQVEMQNLRPCLQPTQSEAPGTGPSHGFYQAHLRITVHSPIQSHYPGSRRPSEKMVTDVRRCWALCLCHLRRFLQRCAVGPAVPSEA